MRSAKPPTMSAGVMIAKVIWNIANTVSGIEPLTASCVTPARNALSRPPIQAFAPPPSPKARL